MLSEHPSSANCRDRCSLCLLAGDSASAKKRVEENRFFPLSGYKIESDVDCLHLNKVISQFAFVRLSLSKQSQTKRKTQSARVCVESLVVCRDNKFHYCFFIVSAQSYGNRNRLRFKSRVCAAHSSSTAWENLRKLI